jgi:acetylornithine/N-succinyldiaminopimelate aminotransferase
VAQPGFLAQVRERSRQLKRGLDDIAAELGSPPAVGRGLLLALQLPQPAQAELAAAALFARADGVRDGLIVNAARPERLRLVPALTISEEEVELALAMLRESLLGRA